MASLLLHPSTKYTINTTDIPAVKPSPANPQTAPAIFFLFHPLYYVRPSSLSPSYSRNWYLRPGGAYSITGEHSKYDKRYTQKPTYFPIFTNNIWSCLLWSPVIAVSSSPSLLRLVPWKAFFISTKLQPFLPAAFFPPRLESNGTHPRYVSALSG